MAIKQNYSINLAILPKKKYFLLLQIYVYYFYNYHTDMSMKCQLFQRFLD